MFDLNAPRDPMTTVDTFRRILISGEAFSGLARVCLARMKGQLKKRIGTATAETVLILLIDPRTKFSVESLIVPSSTPETEKHASDGETQQSQQSSEVVSAGSKLLVDAHREMFCSLHAHDLNVVETNAAMTSPNFDLVPYVEVICGAPIKAVAEGEALKMTLHEQADRVLEEWLQYTVDWVATAVQHAPEKTKTSDNFTPPLLLSLPISCGACSDLVGKSPIRRVQEHVFSTGGIVMSNRCTRTDNYRAEMQVLLKHNQKVIKHIETSDSENVAL
ncbi:hypothetical protein L917_21615 [Phytophthora nicotianae]|uniref:Uncharacterized protein n=1 Tax=Phytophthora nicotianae TaxID=4792 RepID=W2JWX5_PHYNI|nr:hypothetical protein L917_21615 [Phytophthora nicotianae]